MQFKLEKVVPWGRSFEEYLDMFALSEPDLQKRIIGCGDGPASFNSILTRQGGKIISADPIYHFSSEEIKQCIDESYDVILDLVHKNRDEFVWDKITSVEELGRIRMAAMNDFLEDFTRGKEENRYITANLPTLPFNDREFDIALCSHLLFLYSEHLNAEFHILSIKEMCRVAKEVRIFPLLDLEAKVSCHLEPVVSLLEMNGYKADIETVSYEFHKGGNKMLKIVHFK